MLRVNRMCCCAVYPGEQLGSCFCYAAIGSGKTLGVLGTPGVFNVGRGHGEAR